MIRCKPLLLASAVIAVLASAPQVSAQERAFEIPAQPATDAIPELARQAQVQIVAPAGSLEGVDTPAVQGEMDVREALPRLRALARRGRRAANSELAITPATTEAGRWHTPDSSRSGSDAPA